MKYKARKLIAAVFTVAVLGGPAAGAAFAADSPPDTTRIGFRCNGGDAKYIDVPDKAAPHALKAIDNSKACHVFSYGT